ncbi:MAG: hypothetical protein GKR94_29735 [Gammaproteobacteria bacterium]|nr:hypothetical protein [Gammaproteobacteria bacterium]
MILVDVPGLGEDPDRHDEYIKLYDTLVKELDLLLWVIKADDRKYAFSREAIKENVSKDAKKEVKRGVLEYLKEVAGAVKDIAVDVIEEVWDKLKPSWCLGKILLTPLIQPRQRHARLD